jgi:5'-nucleotidase
MKILLTNDDGYEAAGLNILFDVLKKHFDVYSVAPYTEQSGSSNAFTIYREMRLRKICDRRFSLSGYPADCTNVVLHGDFIPKVDLVVSGINHGPNMGDDIFFSGTVAGARTAYIFDKPGIALSIGSHDPDEQYILEFAEFTAKYIGENFAVGMKPVFLNINYQHIPKEQVKGIKYTNHCRRKYFDTYHITDETETELTFKLSGTVESIGNEGTDYFAVENGYVSITPISIDCADYAMLEELRKKHI